MTDNRASRALQALPYTVGVADCLILAHGAGANRDAPLLVALERAFEGIGVRVVRLNLAFRELRPSGPPRAGDPERDRAGLRDAVAREAMSHERVFLGGHSYGGRQSSMLAAEEPDLVAGLLLLSYPLHPPRQPKQLRTAHLPNLRTAALFVHGSRDPFGSVEEMREAIGLIPGRKALVVSEGAGHELVPRRAGGMEATAGMIAAEFLNFFLPGRE
jgi:predicted alpha/beta-hydrolase family hydrolase